METRIVAVALLCDKIVAAAPWAAIKMTNDKWKKWFTVHSSRFTVHGIKKVAGDVNRQKK